MGAGPGAGAGRWSGNMELSCVPCSLSRMNCGIHTESLTSAARRRFLCRSFASIALISLCTGARVESHCVFFHGRLIRGTAEGCWKRQMKRNWVQREGRLWTRHTFNRACDRCVTWAESLVLLLLQRHKLLLFPHVLSFPR